MDDIIDKTLRGYRDLITDAVDCIKSLEARLAQVTRERDEAAAHIDDLEARLATAVEALRRIEAGHPAGSSLWRPVDAPPWRDIYRDTQRVARLALHQIKGKACPDAQP